MAGETYINDEKIQSIQNATDKLTVLVADDDAPTRILLRAAIAQWGYEVIEAKDGEEAWACMTGKHAPRLLILDWLMPKIDGITLCEKSKAELNYHPYIILLTQVTGTTNIIKGLEAGADEFLSKPFNMAELRSRLSTGARIIQHEINLAKHNILLAEYISKLENLLDTSVNTLQKLRVDHNDTSSFTALQSDLDQMLVLMKNFRKDTTVRK